MKLLHLLDGVSAEAPEGIGRNPLYVAVLMQVAKQHKDTQLTTNSCKEYQHNFLSIKFLFTAETGQS